MDDVEAKLACERASEFAGMSLCCLNANKDFAVLKRKHVGRTRLVHEFAM
jgi:hypothetical protein